MPPRKNQTFLHKKKLDGLRLWKSKTIRSFLEGFQFVFKCPSIRFDESLGSCMVEYIIHSSNDLIFIEAIAARACL